VYVWMCVWVGVCECVCMRVRSSVFVCVECGCLCARVGVCVWVGLSVCVGLCGV
jgi:hypothetical protein